MKLVSGKSDVSELHLRAVTADFDGCRLETTRMVRLTRAYSIASLIGIVIVAIALTWLYRSLAVRALIHYETLSNVELARTVGNMLWPRYADFIATARRIPKSELATRREAVPDRSAEDRPLFRSGGRTTEGSGGPRSVVDRTR